MNCPFKLTAVPTCSLKTANEAVNSQSCVHLQLLNDVLVVGATQRLLAGSCAGRDPPVFGCSLHHGAMDLERQSVDLTVQVHWDGYGPSLSWGKTWALHIGVSSLVLLIQQTQQWSLNSMWSSRASQWSIILCSSYLHLHPYFTCLCLHHCAN